MINHMEDGKPVAKENRKRELVITEGDLQILQFTHDFRLLRIRDLEALTGRKYFP